MKRLLSVFLFCLMIFTLSACSSRNDNSNSLLNAVLNNEKTFITEKGEAMLLQDYMITSSKSYTHLTTNPEEYVFVDFDNDKIDELVINLSSDYGLYLVLHYNGLDIYGYEFGIRSLNSLKVDGSFTGSNGAASTYYCRLTFENNKANITYTAIKDSTANHFELNGKESSIQSINEYINDWNLKKSVEWNKCKPFFDTTNPKESSSTDSNNLTKINLNDYISVSFEGNNLVGYGSVKFDKEKFLLDHIKNVSFNSDNLQVYRELYGNTDKSAANIITKYISVDLDSYCNLSNGDIVKTVWKIDEEKVNTYFEWDYVCTSETFTVTGLTDADTFDPFDTIEIEFSGVAPYGSAHVYNIASSYGGEYKVTPSDNLKNGDIVKVTYSCSDKATMIKKYGKYPSSFEKNYTVNGLDTSTQSTIESENQVLVNDDKPKMTGRVVIQSGSLNVRSESNIDGNVIGQIYKDELVYIIKQDGVWYLIETLNGLKGYVSSIYIESITE